MTDPRALHLGDAYRLLFEASPDGIAWLDRNHRLVQANQTMCGLVGTTRGEIVGRSYGQCCLASEHEPVIACLKAAWEGRQQQIRHDFQREDGTRIAVDARFTPLVVEGAVRALCVIWHDLSEERRLRERTELLEGGLAHLNQIVMITKAEPLDEPGPEIVYVNPALERITGHAPQTVIGGSPRFLQGEDTQRQALDELREALRAQQPVALELLNYKKSGEPFRMQVDIAPVFDEAGRCTHFAAIERDVTPQHRAVERVRLAATALNRTDEGVMVLDAQGRATLVNDAFTAITGYGASEMIGRVPRLDPEHKDLTLFDEIKARIDDSGSWRGELWARRRDGSAYPALTRITQGSDGEGGTHYFVAFQDISQRKDTEARLQYLSSHDGLTALPNRLLLQDRTDKCIDHARRRGGHIALLFLDVDRFKQINDSLGHKAGDELLRLTAARLQSAVRTSDTVARMGGDEFTVLLDDLNAPQDAGVVAGKILQTFSRPMDLAGGSVYVSMSIGISCFPSDGENFNAMLHNADLAMYRAKQQGRGQYHFYSRDMDVDAVRTLTMQTALHEALGRREFRLHYQPIVDLSTGRVAGAEALIRWHTPGLGVVAPSDFIPVAEETGLIVPIGEWVIGEAVREVRRILDDGYPDFRIAVNLSARQFRQQDLVERVADALQREGVDPRHLEFEITETTMIHRVEDAMQMLERLRDLGVSVALDDFGTGYSSLRYLKNFRINYLKIDRSFVSTLPDDNGSAAIVHTIIGMAKGMDVQVIAEGVETHAQLQALRRWGCEEAQGYLLSMPLQADDLRWLLANHATLPLAAGED